MGSGDFGRGRPKDVSAWGQPPRPGPGVLDSIGQSTGPADSVRSIQIPRADVEPMPTSIDLFKGIKTLTLAPTSTVDPAGLNFQLTDENVALISFVSLLLNSPTLATDVELALLLNGQPVEGLDHLFIAPRVAANIERTFPITVRTAQNTRIGIRLTNLGAAPQDVAVTYGGWFHPLTDVQRYTGQPWRTI